MALIRCSICNHTHLVAINAALAAGGKLIATAETFEVSKSALHRHQQRCAGRAITPVATADALSASPRPIPTSIAPADAPRIRLSDELLDAMRPLDPVGNNLGQVLEIKLRHLNAIYAYALSRGIAKDDVASILRAGRAMQRLFELDLSTASQRLRYQAEQFIDPTMQMLASVLDDRPAAPDPEGKQKFATRCNGAGEYHDAGGRYA
ncbi:hypothetical protein [Sphingobium sp. YR657]|uniref:hypothetical protein n=1 Tax=Sphingobium sp. YR657 TaxID=1884366 RepID=UPI003137E76D